MLGWCVERIQLDVGIPFVDDVVPHPGGHDDRPVVFDLVRLVDLVRAPAELDTGAALLDPEKLVAVVVHSRPMSSPG